MRMNLILLQILLLVFASLTNGGKQTLMKSQQNAAEATNQQPNKQPEVSQQQERTQEQFVNEMNYLSDFSNEDNDEKKISFDPYPMLNKLEQDLPAYIPWNPYASAVSQQSVLQLPLSRSYDQYSPYALIPQAAKLVPFFGFPQPVFIPFPLMLPPNMLYSGLQETSSLAEENLSRAANGRRPTTASPGYQHNSPIYYVRLPPTPYMFLPGLGYTPSSASSYTSMVPYPPLTTFQALPLSPIFNLPINFLGNGKPSGIYRIDSAPSNHQVPFSLPVARPGLPNMFRPNNAPHQQAHQYGFSPPPPPSQDSKLTSLKHPFFFNGRPDDLFILPNNLNSLYHDGSFY